MEFNQYFLGGFVVSLTESGNPVCRNPAAPHVVPLLPHVLSLIKIFNEMFTPEAQQLIHDSYKGCLAMPETEKNILLGIVGKYLLFIISCSLNWFLHIVFRLYIQGGAIVWQRLMLLLFLIFRKKKSLYKS